MSTSADILELRPLDRKPVFLELFSGSGHLSGSARAAGYETFTVDIESKYNPDLALDIIKIRKNMLPGSADVIWASPPCTYFSNLNIGNHWDKIDLGYRNYYYVPTTPEARSALRILNKMFKVIRWLKPMYYFIENPRAGLRHFPYMKSIPFRKTVSYYDYGFDYFKPTDIWTNCPSFQPKDASYQNAQKFEKSVLDLNSSYERALVPPALIEYLFNSLPFTPDADASALRSLK